MTQGPLVDRDQPYKLDEQLVVSLCQIMLGRHSLVTPHLRMVGTVAATKTTCDPLAGIDAIHNPPPLPSIVDDTE
jgi:hypothetical protein